MKKINQYVQNPVMAEMLEPFVKYPCKKDKNKKPIVGEYDFTKDPSIWAKPFYELPKDYDKDKKPTPDPEDVTVKIPIFNDLKEPVNHVDLENKQFKAYYKLQLYGIENNPNTGGKVLSWRLVELKVKVLGELKKVEPNKPSLLTLIKLFS